MARFVLLWARDPDEFAATGDATVVVARGDAKAYMRGAAVRLAPRCRGPLHITPPDGYYKERWGWAPHCAQCAGRGWRPMSEAEEVAFTLTGEWPTGNPPAVEDWRERRGFVPRWLLQQRWKERRTPKRTCR
jgi:hypothetical protein